MKNFVQPGETVTLTAPYAVTSGGGLLVGSIFGIATATAASGAEVEVLIEGVVDHARATGASTDWTAGTKIYWDNTNKVITKTATSNTLIGIAMTAAAVGDATGRVRLNGSFS